MPNTNGLLYPSSGIWRMTEYRETCGENLMVEILNKEINYFNKLSLSIYYNQILCLGGKIKTYIELFLSQRSVFRVMRWGDKWGGARDIDD